MATAAVSSARRDVKEYSFTWEGRDRSGKVLKANEPPLSACLIAPDKAE